MSRKSYSAILLSASRHSSEKCSSDRMLRRCVRRAFTAAKPPCTVAVDDCSEQLKLSVMAKTWWAVSSASRVRPFSNWLIRLWALDALSSTVKCQHSCNFTKKWQNNWVWLKCSIDCGKSYCPSRRTKCPSLMWCPEPAADCVCPGPRSVAQAPAEMNAIQRIACKALAGACATERDPGFN